jgi:phage terminase large subunit
MTEYRAHPGPQRAFLQSSADEVLYGGAAGGGKSWALLLEAARNIGKPQYRALLLRRTHPELRMSLIDQSFRMFGDIGEFNAATNRWRFESGAEIWFGHMQHDRDMAKYQSAEFALIGFDELTTFTQRQYEFMLSRNRNTAGIKNKIRAASNPGQVGHGWVKERFVSALDPYEFGWFRRVGEDDEERVPWGTAGARTRQFIPARLEDNPTLIEADPTYRVRLEALPYRLRQMLLEGSWDVSFEGLVYPEFDSTVHLVSPFDIPRGWRRIRAVDFGFNNPCVIQWWAISPDDEMYLYREVYHTGLLNSRLGSMIHELSMYSPDDEGLTGAESIEATVADHDADGRAELSQNANIQTVAARKAKVDGIKEVSERLTINPKTGRSRLYIVRGCTVQVDPRLRVAKRPTSTEDEIGIYQRKTGAGDRAETEEPIKLNDHGMDAMRYACMYLTKTEDIVLTPTADWGGAAYDARPETMPA